MPPSGGFGSSSMSRITKLAQQLTVVKDLGPERDYTERGRFRKVISTMSAHKLGMLSVNLATALFAAPLIVMFFILMTMYETSSIAEAGLNFSGFIGIGYGLVDNTVEGINIIYGIRQDFFLYFFTPGMMILSIGCAGAYHCIRNWMWGLDVKPKHYFRGIKLHWWKFLIAFTFMGLVGTNAAYSTIELMRLMSTVGSASAGMWIWCITALLIGLLTVLFMGIWLPMSVMFKTSYRDGIKNAILCFLIFAIQSVLVTALMIAPLFLTMINIINYLIYVMMLFYGGSFYMACNISFGMFIGDMTLNSLYEYEQKQNERRGKDKSGKGGKRKADDRTAAAQIAQPETDESASGGQAEQASAARPSAPKQNKGGGKGGKGGGKRPHYRRK